MPIAYPCSVRRCDESGGVQFGADVISYSLQDSLFFNGTPLSFVPVCPPNSICPPGSLPPIIVYPPGTFVVPKVPVIPGFPIVVQLMGCQSMVSITLPAGSSTAAIAAAANSVILQVAAQQAVCDVTPPTTPGGPGGPGTPVGPNPVPDNVTMGDLPTVICRLSGLPNITISPVSDIGYVFQKLSGNLPNGLTFAINGDEIVWSGTATTFGTFTFTLMAGAPEKYGEKTYTVKVVGVSTASLTNGTVGTPYTLTMAVGGPFTGTITWAIVSGSLPAGLSLNTVTGEISGTPTTAGTSNVTIAFTDDLITCSKAFSLTVADPVVCADWTTLVWGPPNESTIGAGTATVFAIQNVVSVLSCGSPGGDADTAIADITGSLIYNGPGCNCNLHLEMTANGNTNFVNGGVRISTVEGGTILLPNQFSTFGAVIIDQPFSLPDTGGLPFTVVVFATGDSGELGDSNTNGFGLYAEITNL